MAYTLFNAETVGWQLGSDSVTVDILPNNKLDDPSVTTYATFSATADEINTLEIAINEHIRCGRGVKASSHSRSDILGPNIESESQSESKTIAHLRGAPKGQAASFENLRIVHIDGLDANPCGGTHLNTLGENIYQLYLSK